MVTNKELKEMNDNGDYFAQDTLEDCLEYFANEQNEKIQKIFVATGVLITSLPIEIDLADKMLDDILCDVTLLGQKLIKKYNLNVEVN